METDAAERACTLFPDGQRRHPICRGHELAFKNRGHCPGRATDLKANGVQHPRLQGQEGKNSRSTIRGEDR
eukprot:12426435-Karenia_brevis.AAC.2